MPDPGAETAQELILEVYRQRSALAETGRTPRRVVLSRSQYDLIQHYRNTLGSLPDGVDYLDRYRLFDLEVCVDDVSEPRVTE